MPDGPGFPAEAPSVKIQIASFSALSVLDAVFGPNGRGIYPILIILIQLVLNQHFIILHNGFACQIDRQPHLIVFKAHAFPFAGFGFLVFGHGLPISGMLVTGHWFLVPGSGLKLVSGFRCQVSEKTS